MAKAKRGDPASSTNPRPKRGCLRSLRNLALLLIFGCVGLPLAYIAWYTSPLGSDARATSTARAFITGTALALAPTRTAERQLTLEIEYATASIIALTPTDTPTRTLTPSKTPLPTRTPLPSRTPIPSRTPPPSPVAGQVTITINSATLNIRSGPGTGYSRVAVATRGESFRVTGRTTDADWLKIERDGGSGWISSSLQYIVIVGKLMALPVIDMKVINAEPIRAGAGGSSGGSGASGGSSGGQCPKNCTEAKARGMSAQAAAACGLDRDGDGVACYGD